MILKSADINYGFNGEASTASLTYADNTACASAGSGSGEAQIQQLIKDFVLYETSKSNEAGFKNTTKHYIDKHAKALESIAVLVRGISCSTLDSNAGIMKLYNHSETGVLPNVPFNDTAPRRLRSNLGIIGRTFSVITAVLGLETYTRYYAGGEMVAEMPLTSGLTPAQLVELNNQFNDVEQNASLKHGYYLSDLKELIGLFGYSTANFPTDNSFILIETGGSLKDCISAVATMYGLYWNCRGSKIEFFDAEQVARATVPNNVDSNDPNILSASYTEGEMGKSKVGIVAGSAQPPTSSGTVNGGTKSKTVFFNQIDLEKAYGEGIFNLVDEFFSFFRFAGSEEQFNLYFLAAYFQSETVRSNSVVKNTYGDYADVIDTTRKTWSSFSDDDKVALESLNVDKNDKFFNLKTTDGKTLPLPSTTQLYGLLQAACSALLTIYVSNGVSAYFTENYSISATEGMTVSKPYAGSKLISEIPELEHLHFIMNLVAKKRNPDGAALDAKIRDVRGVVTSTEGEELEQDYFYVAQRDIWQQNQNGQIQKDVDTACQETRSQNRIVSVPSRNLNLFCFPQERLDAVITAINSSKYTFDYLAAIDSADAQIEMQALKIEKENDGGGGGDEEEDFSAYEYKSYSLNMIDGGSLAPVDIVIFSANLSEAAFLNANFNSLARGSRPSKSSSTTYNGLVIPSYSLTLSSLSVTFSGDGITTTIAYSTKDPLSLDQSVVLGDRVVSQSRNVFSSLRPSQKNFLGLN